MKKQGKEDIMNLQKGTLSFFKNNSALCGAITFVALLVSGNAIAQSMPLAEGVAAIVNDEPITSFDVRQRVRYLLARQRIEKPTNEIIAQAAEAALDSLINERLQLQEAKKFKLKVSDAEVDRMLESRVKSNGGTLEQLFTDLRSSGLSINSYRDTTRAEIAWQRIIVGRYGSRIKIPAERIKEEVSRIQASANKKQYNVSEIYLETPYGDTDEETLKGAQTLVKKLRGGENFRANAEIYSYAPSAATGGSLGWVLEGELRPEIAAVIDKIEEGQISDPIKVQGGYMIISVASKHEAKDLTINYSLKQISKSVNEKADESTWRKAEAQVMATKNQYRNNCAFVEKAAKTNGVAVTDLGKVEAGDLSEETIGSLNGLANGGSTNISRSTNKVYATIMCEKIISGEDIPTSEQIADNLHDQELNLIARRYLRDIRREAAIVKR
jgi:peptidyl-prolyl cis-trans isomerase SurA